MRASTVVITLLLSCMLFAAGASAEGAAPTSGVLVQVRMPVTSVSSLLNSAVGVPQFVVGLRSGRIAYGLGLGLSRAGYSDKASGPGYEREYKIGATLFQVAPTVWFDFWQAPDGQTTGNVVISGQYGRVTFKQENKGFDISGPWDYESKGSGNLFGFLVGVGGDHHLGPHFALGLEAGVQGTFASDVKMDDGNSPKEGFSSSLLYGAMRATITY
jgi:hypothetical protein